MNKTNQQYGLHEENINKINRVFSRYKSVEEVILYGSRAKGNFRPGSDIDLTIIGKNLSLRDLNKITLELDDLLMPYTFDVSIYRHIKDPDLIDHITRVGKVFYTQYHKDNVNIDGF